MADTARALAHEIVNENRILCDWHDDRDFHSDLCERVTALAESAQLMDVLQRLYRSEINCSISCFWDGGWDVKLGDALNGFGSKSVFENEQLREVAVWLQAEAVRLYPDSEFVRALKEKVHAGL